MSQITSNPFSSFSLAGLTFNGKKNAPVSTDLANLSLPPANSSSVTDTDSAQTTTASTPPAAPKEDYAAEFLDYMKKSPAERMRDDILKSLGLTEDDLKNMPPDKRAAVEKEIADLIKKKLGADDGQLSKAFDQQTSQSASGQKLSDGVNSTLLQLQEDSSGEDTENAGSTGQNTAGTQDSGEDS